MRIRDYCLAVLSVFVVTLTACNPEIPDPPAGEQTLDGEQLPEGEQTPAGEQTPGACETSAGEPIRRLSAFEYTRALDELVGVQIDEALLPATSGDSIFATEEAALGSSSLLVDGQLVASEAVADAVLDTLEAGDGAAFLGCEASDPSCVDEFIDRFGKQAFRRPVDAEEHARLRALYDEIAPTEGTDLALATLVQAMVLSPRFGFHTEERASSGAIDGWSIASRMSFFLWSSPPDEALLAAAETNELADPDVREEHARRMLMDPRARESVVRFYRELLDLDLLTSYAPLAEAYPEWTEALRGEMFDEIDRFVEATVFEQDGTFETLLTSRWVEAGPALSALYGIEPGHTELPPERAGLLTRAGVLTTTSHAVQPSPVFRGLAVLDRIMCRQIGVPPPGISDVAADVETVTNRERYAVHSSDPACAGCHSQIDPIGFTFEEFDAIGAYRTHDNGQPVDATGEVFGQEVDGAAELSTALADSDEVAQCAVTQWLRFGRGHDLDGGERCAGDDIAIESAADGGTVQDLLVAIVRSPLFIQ